MENILDVFQNGYFSPGHNSKWLFSPPPDRNMREIFSDLHCENLLGSIREKNSENVMIPSKVTLPIDF